MGTAGTSATGAELVDGLSAETESPTRGESPAAAGFSAETELPAGVAASKTESGTAEAEGVATKPESGAVSDERFLADLSAEAELVGELSAGGTETGFSVYPVEPKAETGCAPCAILSCRVPAVFTDEKLPDPEKGRQPRLFVPDRFRRRLKRLQVPFERHQMRFSAHFPKHSR